METTTKITIHVDCEYEYDVEASSDTIQLSYREILSDSHTQVDIAFATLDEMEAVAQAMLRVVKIGRETKLD